VARDSFKAGLNSLQSRLNQSQIEVSQYRLATSFFQRLEPVIQFSDEWAPTGPAEFDALSVLISGCEMGTPNGRLALPLRGAAGQ